MFLLDCEEWRGGLRKKKQNQKNPQKGERRQHTTEQNQPLSRDYSQKTRDFNPNLPLPQNPLNPGKDMKIPLKTGGKRP